MICFAFAFSYDRAFLFVRESETDDFGRERERAFATAKLFNYFNIFVRNTARSTELSSSYFNFRHQYFTKAPSYTNYKHFNLIFSTTPLTDSNHSNSFTWYNDLDNPVYNKSWEKVWFYVKGRVSFVDFRPAHAQTWAFSRTSFRKTFSLFNSKKLWFENIFRWDIDIGEKKNLLEKLPMSC